MIRWLIFALTSSENEDRILIRQKIIAIYFERKYNKRRVTYVNDFNPFLLKDISW